MSDLSKNKIAAAILLAGLIGMITGKVTEFLYDGGPQHAGGHHQEKRGYSIDVPEGGTESGGAAAVTTASDISALYPTADTKAGESYFQKKCTVCHTVDKGGAGKVGPNLYGVMNRKVAAVAGFSYSEGMKSHSDRSWNWDEMNHFQFAPRKWVKGTIMAFAGTPKDQERANLIVYLNSQSDSPSPLPKVTAKAVEAPADPAKDSAAAKDDRATPVAAATAPAEKAAPVDSGNKNATPKTEATKAAEPKSGDAKPATK